MLSFLGPGQDTTLLTYIWWGKPKPRLSKSDVIYKESQPMGQVRRGFHFDPSKSQCPILWRNLGQSMKGNQLTSQTQRILTSILTWSLIDSGTLFSRAIAPLWEPLSVGWSVDWSVTLELKITENVWNLIETHLVHHSCNSSIHSFIHPSIHSFNHSSKNVHCEAHLLAITWPCYMKIVIKRDYQRQTNMGQIVT